MVLSGFYPRDCRYEPSEVRVKPHLPLRWWLAHLSWFCRAVLPQLASELQAYTRGVGTLKIVFRIKLDQQRISENYVGIVKDCA